jgi:hypothetical protein
MNFRNNKASEVFLVFKMKKATIYDILFIILLAIILVLVNEFDINKELFRFRYIGFLAVYFIGRYISRILYK